MLCKWERYRCHGCKFGIVGIADIMSLCWLSSKRSNLNSFKFKCLGIWEDLDTAIGNELGGIVTIFAVKPQHESSCVGVVVPTIVSWSNVATVFAVAAAAATPTFVFMSLSILSSLSYTTSVTKQVLAAVTTKLTNRNGLFLLIYCLFFMALSIK